jgi:mono/diheme cytochrome c family protein
MRQKTESRKFLILLVIVAALVGALVVSGCGGGSSSSSEATTTEEAEPETGGAAEEEAEAEEPAEEEAPAEEEEPAEEPAEEEAQTGGAEAGDESAAVAAGKTVFTANCGTCHTLKEAGTSGTVGPNLDELEPDLATVEGQVESGGGGMPAFKGQLSPEEITDVATYVSTVAGTE